MADKTAYASLRDVLVKYLHIAEQDYKGHVNDNVLNIFNDLSDDEKKAFLKGVLHIHSMVAGHVDTIPRHIPKSRTQRGALPIDAEDENQDQDEIIQAVNRHQKLAMKIYLTKLLATVVLAAGFSVFVVSMLSKNEVEIPMMEGLMQTGKVINKMLGI